MLNGIIVILGLFLITTPSLATIPIHAQSVDEAEILFNKAKESFSKSDYKEAIIIYDEILEILPGNISTLKMKGIAQSNVGLHEQSLKQFYKIYQQDKSDIIALVGLGLGFGNLGEYQEANHYFEKASIQNPNSTVIQNYRNFVNSVLEKYPYTPTEKPIELTTVEPVRIPQWIQPIAGWWAEEKIKDTEFINTIEFLISNKIMEIPNTISGQKN